MEGVSSFVFGPVLVLLLSVVRVWFVKNYLLFGIV